MSPSLPLFSHKLCSYSWALLRKPWGSASAAGFLPRAAPGTLWVKSSCQELENPSGSPQRSRGGIQCSQSHLYTNNLEWGPCRDLDRKQVAPPKGQCWDEGNGTEKGAGGAKRGEPPLCPQLTLTALHSLPGEQTPQTLQLLMFVPSCCCLHPEPGQPRTPSSPWTP